jgi:hypothetical protein
MADEQYKLSELPQANSVAASDRVVLVANTTGIPKAKTVSISNLTGSMTLSNTVPATASSNGTAGVIARDSNYIYVCVANNTWKRSLLETW